MSEETTSTPLRADNTKLITDSKLFALARQEKLLSFLTPNIAVQMMAEAELDENFPRTDDDKDDTRILINYTNIRNKSSVYKINDGERLTRTFDIDHFMNGFMLQIGVDPNISDIVDGVNSTLMSALNMALMATMSMDSELQSPQTKLLSETVFKTIVALVFDDPLDVFVVFSERPSEVPDEETTSIITGMWTIKLRDKDKADEITLEQLSALDRGTPANSN